MEEGFVGVDVAYSVEERLVEQCGFDWRLAIAEERDEVFERDGEGLFAGARVGFGCDGEAAEAAGVDETELASAAEDEDGVGVGRDGRVGGGDEETAGHAEVDEELGGFFLSGEVDNDGLAYAVDAVNPAAGEDFRDLVGWRFEGLRFVAGPDGADGLAVDSFVDAVGYGLDFGEFGHAFAVYGERLNTDCTDSRRDRESFVCHG